MYFITAVTAQRTPIIVDHARSFWKAIEKAESDESFDLLAWVLMPDHFHAIIDPGSSSLSNIVKRIKLSFAYQVRHQAGLYRGRVWQHRYWDHIIRDDDDMNRHIDYTHYNPVKHGLTVSPFEWEHSSIHEYHSRGFYSSDWGTREHLSFDGKYGE